MEREFADFPKHKQAYIRTFDRMLKKRNEDGLKTEWKTGKDVFDWWLYGFNDHGQMNIYDFIRKESR